TPPDLSKLPTGYVQVLAKALCKNPAQRYASMADMARAVEAIDAPAVVARPASARPVAVPVAKAVSRPRPQEPVLTVLPVLTGRARMAELCGSLALTTLFAGLATALWAALGNLRDA